MTLQESVKILKIHHLLLRDKIPLKKALSVALDAIERSIDIKEWDAEEAQIEQICERCNGQGCTKCSR